MKNRDGFFHLHMISDATGETLITVGARRGGAILRGSRRSSMSTPMVRDRKQIDRIVAELEAEPGIVLYTLVDRTLGENGWRPPAGRSASPAPRCSSRCSSCCSPISARLGARRVGAQHVLDAEYFRRIDALNFTLIHDDGQLAGSLEDADVVLVGVSRTSKTPTRSTSPIAA